MSKLIHTLVVLVLLINYISATNTKVNVPYNNEYEAAESIYSPNYMQKGLKHYEYLESNSLNDNILKDSSDKNDEYPIVWLNDGGLKGFTMKTIGGKSFKAFQAIPFAQPPIGNLRFRAPMKNSPWKGIRDAMSNSPTCLQVDFIQQYNVSGTEDCLYLNVYTPDISKRTLKKQLPVMVFIHGGGFFFGSSNLYGPGYLMEEEIILVSMNYRLGPFGFYSTGDGASPGNNGLKDQALALEWVQNNIHNFGGDASRVTIFGESAGAGSVQFHMLSPLSRGKFHHAISESGCTMCFWSISERAVEVGKQFANAFNCKGPNSTATVECLRNVDGDKLVLGQLGFLKWVMYPVVVFGPVVEPKHEGAFLDDLPENIYRKGEAAQVPWITGFNSDEGALNIASLFLHPTAVPEMNDKWDTVGPVFLELEDSSENPVKAANDIREFYLGNKNVSYDTRKESIKMFSDRYVVVCGVKSIYYHAQLNQQPVYAYHFNYRGNYGMVQLIGQKTEDWGVAHIDELIYLMNNTAYYATLKPEDEEYKVSRIIVNLWANFAKVGRPFLTTKGGGEYYLWTPVDPQTPEMEYLEINESPKMGPDPFADRVRFWKSLNLVNEPEDLTLTHPSHQHHYKKSKY